MKKFKLNYLFICIVSVLLALALWPAIPWFSGGENRVAEIKARGVLRVSTVSSPLIYTTVNGKAYGLDYELAELFARYLGVRLEITPRQNINELFDDLDNDDADLLAAGLVYNATRSTHYEPGPTYYSVSQQLVYRVGSLRPRTLGAIDENQLVIAPGQTVLNDLEALKAKKYPSLSWTVDANKNSNALLSQVLEGKIDYTIADSVAVNLFQRVHPQLAVALDVTDEQPVSWYTRRDGDHTLAAAMLGFFNQINEDGTLARLEEKYLGHGNDFDYVDTRSFLRAVDNLLPELQPLFEKYATDIDWKLLAAISYQESHWDPQATSPTGVRGLMMLTRNTAQSVGLTDRLDPEQSISGGARYLSDMMKKVPETVPEEERIWFALAAYNMGYAHMLDARALTAKQKGNPDSWADVKQRLSLLSLKPYYTQTTYGYARGHEAYAYVENIRKYQISLVGYLLEKEKKAAQLAKIAQDYPIVRPQELIKPPFGPLPLGPFSQDDAFERTHLVRPNTLVPVPHS
ncbi:membrane-bound lytic murein transglycosylase MltF [Siccibacter turicensis]|uniref:Membrane-bound lytic murein transglycosylase F n=1 Tax=Siccibacter turicensis TaxID=357233 RepID=A0A2P8VIS0_9ENTR|nr:membrane-bound lytic murein transglycosylase MltF [Siccibacter turicensis]PSN07461.1 membrane-bound lytic murein transglycosylase MltF [Siccibacter turicensis]